MEWPIRISATRNSILKEYTKDWYGDGISLGQFARELGKKEQGENFAYHHN